jgi:serine/threonine protein kinase
VWDFRHPQSNFSEAIQLLFEFYPFLLSHEIESRIKLQSPFNEEELWYLLYEIVCASKDFEKLNMKSGDVRPSNIVVNEAGQMRLVNRCTFPN